jgi:predicted aminopeptidase
MRARFLLLFLILLSGCSPFYVIRAAYEEGKILWRREPIEELLKNPDLDAQTREKFELVLAVRVYARDKLKLRVKGSYAAYTQLDRPVLSYVLTAAPQTSLEPYTWWFPFVGRVPYKGFFSQAEAESKASGFQQRGFDTTIRPVSAFSTLGWFDDPLLDHLLRLDKVTLAEVILHELFHNTLFVVGSVNFNESLANFFGNRAGMNFFRDRYGEGSPEYLQASRAWKEEFEFATFLTRVADSLEELYQKDLSKEEKLRLRQSIFSGSQKEWASLVADKARHQYRGYSEQEVNNAVVAHYLLYLGGLELFESLYQAQGKNLVKMVAAIQQSIEGGEPPFEAVRQLVPDQSPLPKGETPRGVRLAPTFYSKSSKARNHTLPRPNGSSVLPSTIQ